MKKTFKNNISFFLVALGMALFIFQACSEDFFNDTAGDRITPDQHYKTFDDLMPSLGGAIAPLQNILPRLIMLDGLRSDMMLPTQNAESWMRDINLHIYTRGSQATDPSDLYKTIVNINEVLTHIDKISKNDPKFNKNIAPQIIGALIGMRAWTYLTIARLYGQTVYFTDNLASLPANLQQTILTKDALVDTLINQLLPYIHDSRFTKIQEVQVGTGYVNNKALLGELYLEKNDYAKAVEYLKIACESRGNDQVMYKIDQSLQNAAWSGIFLNSESVASEVFAVMPYASREGQYNPLAYWFGYDLHYAVMPSPVLMDSFMVQIPAQGTLPGDIWRGVGSTFGLNIIGQVDESTHIFAPHITKYAFDSKDPFSTDIIISRASDVHLKLAEALNRLGDPASQTIAINLVNGGINSMNPKPAPWATWTRNRGVRGRVTLRPRQVPAALEGEARMLFIEDMIIAERALELAFEGKRWDDLVRIANRRNQPEYLADKVAEKFKGTPQYEIIRNKLMTPANWYLPWQ